MITVAISMFSRYIICHVYRLRTVHYSGFLALMLQTADIFCNYLYWFLSLDGIPVVAVIPEVTGSEGTLGVDDTHTDSHTSSAAAWLCIYSHFLLGVPLSASLRVTQTFTDLHLPVENISVSRSGICRLFPLVCQVLWLFCNSSIVRVYICKWGA